MKTYAAFVFLFFVTWLSSAQQIVLSSCNDTPILSDRNDCLEASLENLIIKEVFRNLDIVKLQPGHSLELNTIINVSSVGVFSISEVNTPSFGLAKSLDNVIAGLKPIPSYKNEKGDFTTTNFTFYYNFKLSNNESITVIDDDDEIVLTQSIHPPEEEEEEKSPEEKQSKKKKWKKASKKSKNQPFSVIEEVPVFPGCNQRTNEEKKNCMSSKISAFISDNFNLYLADDLDLSGRQRIAVQFRISEYGFVSNIQVRAPHPELEKEAIRTISILPRMKPGRQKGNVVGVLYSLPILFDVEEEDDGDKK